MSVRAELGVVGVVPRGQWVPGIDYEYLSIVTNAGSAYIAKKFAPNGTLLTDTEYWDILVAKGDKGDTGNGIASVVKTSTAGLVDTYTITFTNGATTTYTVTNGAKGDKGDTGNGIASVVTTKTSTVGNVDTYTQVITYTDGNTATFTYTVTNGAVTSVNGMTGDVIVRDVEHADVADNLTPYSEDSGTTQENPFISQGTGTDNNSVIVTTGTIARQLEKQGNTPVVNQLVGGARTRDGITATYDSTTNIYSLSGTSERAYAGVHSSRDFIQGHKYIVGFKVLKNPNNIPITFGALSISGGTTATYTAFTMTNTTSNSGVGVAGFAIGTDLTGIEYQAYIIDVTQWFNGNDNIPADLLANPSHFSWYYNGSLSYDAGSLQDCNGRYLECGQGRNLFDQEWELGSLDTQTGAPYDTTSRGRSKNYMIIVPNCIYYGFVGSTGSVYVFFYDKDKNFINYVNGTNRTFEAPSNACFFKFYSDNAYGTTYKGDISIELYYTPEQGGEGYGEMHDYIAPIRIDTGNETLKAFDKKLPSGVIERATLDEDLSTVSFTYDTNYWITSQKHRWVATIVGIALPSSNDVVADIKCDTFVPRSLNKMHAVGFTGIGIGIATNGNLYVYNNSNTVAPTGNAQIRLATPTTEQGTPFSEYAPINDYSYMAWFDTDGNLVSIPQGCKLFYPVDYKGFVDDLVMYTNGDATALAKEEDITDSALNARGYYKMQDLSSGITDVAGLTYAIKKAYKCGNVVTLTIRATNGTGSAIEANATLCQLGQALTPAYPIFVPVSYPNSTATIWTDGKVYVGSQIPANNYFIFTISYAVS